MTQREERNQIRMEAAVEHAHQFSVSVLNNIFKMSVQELIADAQRGKPSKHKLERGKLTKAQREAVAKFGTGRLPVDTGALRASLISELDGGQLRIGKKSKDHTAVGYDATATIANVKIGSDLKFGWTVHYAEIIEFGGGNRTPNHFMTGAVNQWPKWVGIAVAKAKIRRNQLGLGIGGRHHRPPLFLT